MKAALQQQKGKKKGLQGFLEKVDSRDNQIRPGGGAIRRLLEQHPILCGTGAGEPGHPSDQQTWLCCRRARYAAAAAVEAKHC